MKEATAGPVDADLAITTGEGDGLMDAIEQHMAKITSSRQDAAKAQAKSTEKMTASTNNQKQPPMTVLIPVFEFDRVGRLDCRNIPDVFSQVTSHWL